MDPILDPSGPQMYGYGRLACPGPLQEAPQNGPHFGTPFGPFWTPLQEGSGSIPGILDHSGPFWPGWIGPGPDLTILAILDPPKMTYFGPFPGPVQTSYTGDPGPGTLRS